MLSDPAKYIIAASLIIAIMFLLFAKATKTMIRVKRSNSIPRDDVEGADNAVNDENPLIYPLYVDCSFELLATKATAPTAPPGTQ